MTRVVVTGAKGFLGRYVCPLLAARGYDVVRTLRGSAVEDAEGAAFETHAVGGIGPDTDWRAALAGAEAVVHLAARAHVMNEIVTDPAAEFMRVNAAGTLRLARQAAEYGVKRLVFVSSVKVNGEKTADTPFRETDPPKPEDDYAISKRDAEIGLCMVAEETGMEAVILRAPLIYGASVKGNFFKLLRLCDGLLPLPLAAIDNRRSLIFAGNMADAVACSLEAEEAGGQTYRVGDDDDVSTPELIRRIATALGRTGRLFPVPVGLLRMVGGLAGKTAVIDRLTGSSWVDTSRIRHELEWAPPHGMKEGLEETAAWYKNRESV